MMVYVNGQEIAQLVLGGLAAQAWVYAPEVSEVRPEQYLAGLEAWLRKHHLTQKDIEGFVLVSGPGSATSLRTSHAMINALALVWQVRILSIEKPSDMPDQDCLSLVALASNQNNEFGHTSALPTYARAPTITVTKRDVLKRKVLA